jgi:hypothetical protein
MRTLLFGEGKARALSAPPPFGYLVADVANAATNVRNLLCRVKSPFYPRLTDIVRLSWRQKSGNQASIIACPIWEMLVHVFMSMKSGQA